MSEPDDPRGPRPAARLFPPSDRPPARTWLERALIAAILPFYLAWTLVKEAAAGLRAAVARVLTAIDVVLTGLVSATSWLLAVLLVRPVRWGLTILGRALAIVLWPLGDVLTVFRRGLAWLVRFVTSPLRWCLVAYASLADWIADAVRRCLVTLAALLGPLGRSLATALRSIRAALRWLSAWAISIVAPLIHAAHRALVRVFEVANCVKRRLAATLRSLALLILRFFAATVRVIARFLKLVWKMAELPARLFRAIVAGLTRLFDLARSLAKTCAAAIVGLATWFRPIWTAAKSALNSVARAVRHMAVGLQAITQVLAAVLARLLRPALALIHALGRVVSLVGGMARGLWRRAGLSLSRAGRILLSAVRWLLRPPLRLVRWLRGRARRTASGIATPWREAARFVKDTNTRTRASVHDALGAIRDRFRR